MLVYITIINIHYPTPIWNYFLLTKTSCTLSYSFFDTRQDYGMKDVQIHKLKNEYFGPFLNFIRNMEFSRKKNVKDFSG